eukprot:363410-Chlamydomonas_euryale.AAC.2
MPPCRCSPGRGAPLSSCASEGRPQGRDWHRGCRGCRGDADRAGGARGGRSQHQGGLEVRAGWRPVVRLGLHVPSVRIRAGAPSAPPPRAAWKVVWRSRWAVISSSGGVEDVEGGGGLHAPVFCTESLYREFGPTAGLGSGFLDPFA